jgi:hypothetical protein
VVLRLASVIVVVRHDVFTLWRCEVKVTKVLMFMRKEDEGYER